MQIDPAGITWDSAPAAPGPTQIIPPRPKPEQTPSGFRPTPAGGLAPIPGGPQDASSDPKFNKDVSDTAFNQAKGLRNDYDSDQRVKDFLAVTPGYVAALNTADNPQGDQSLIYAFAKMMDPNSVVRESEFETAANTDTLYGQTVARLKKEMGEGGQLRPEARQRLRSEMRRRYDQILAGYTTARKEYGELAESFGASPENVIRTNAGAPYADDVRAAAQRLRGPASDEQVAAFVRQNANLNADQLRKLAKLELGRDIDNAEEVLAAFGQSGQISDRVITPDPNVEAFKAGVGDLAEGAGDVLGLLGNPLNAGINMVAGTNLSTDLGQTFRDATGLPEGDPLASAINKGGMAGMTGAGAARAFTGPIAEIMAAQPVQQTIGSAAAGGGVEYGRQKGLGPVGQAALGLGAGATGFGAANVVRNTAGRMTGGPSEIAQIAQRQRVDLMPADVGGPVAKRVTGAAAQAPFSASPIIKGATKAQEQIGSAASRAAQREGNVQSVDEAGESLQRAGLQYAPKQAARIGRVYDRAEQRAKGVTIKPLGAVALLDEQIARLSQTGDMAAPLVKDLQSIRGSIANGVSVSGMRDVRTLLSQGTFNGKIRSSMEKGIYKQVIKAVSQDIENGLRAAGRKDALNMFKIADKAWEERIDHIDRVLEPVLGNGKSGEQVLEAVESMARGKSGGVRRLTALLGEMPAEEVSNIRATIVERLGKATAGHQDDAGSKFSANTFLTRWNGMSSKGKAALFGGGELRQNLDEIAKLADATAQTGKYANTSNTVGGIVSNAGIIAGVATQSPKAAIVSAIVQFATGRLMASPKFTAWLARVPNSPQAQIKYTEKLGQIAASEPIIANDIASVQSFLNSGSYRAAAGAENQAQDRR